MAVCDVTAHHRSAVGDRGDERLFDRWTRDYALLGLRLDRLLPGTVLAWLGPAAWRAAVEAEPPPAAGALVSAADELLDRLSATGYAAERVVHLEGQVVALRTLARLAGGAAFSLAEQVEFLLGVAPRRELEATFAAARDQLEALLPGHGSLAERYDAWRRAVAVPAAEVPDVLARITAEARTRTERHLPLPAGEGVAFVFGADLPYRAYTRSLGQTRSRVEVHTGRPLPFDELVDFVAHEAYPGHHAEHALREFHQYRGAAQGEYAFQVANTPASLVWEAVATNARELVFPEGGDWLTTELAPPLGAGVDPGRDAVIWDAVGTLDAAEANAALLLHEENRPPAEVADYLAERSLMTPTGAARFVELVAGLPWRVYVFAYGLGRHLLAPRLAGADGWQVLRRLLTEPTHPSLLVAGPRSPLEPLPATTAGREQ